MYKFGQLPVFRGRGDAGLVLKQAEQALAGGACVIVYPEGTATRDPDLWPMVGKTGAARLALTTGAPVIPIAQWGAQERPALRVEEAAAVAAQDGPDGGRAAGGPVAPTQGQRLRRSTLRAATADIMADITGLLGEIRQRDAAGRTLGSGRGRPGPVGPNEGRPAPGRPRARAERGGGEARPGMKSRRLGAGSWGTTFAQVLCDAGTVTVLYSRRPELAKAIAMQHENPDYLPGSRADARRWTRRSDWPRRWTARTSWRSPCPRRRCGPT